MVNSKTTSTSKSLTEQNAFEEANETQTGAVRSRHPMRFAYCDAIQR